MCLGPLDARNGVDLSLQYVTDVPYVRVCGLYSGSDAGDTPYTDVIYL